MFPTQGCDLRYKIGWLTYALCAANTCCSMAAIPISAPQKHRDRPSATWVGSLRPASHMACSHHSIARCRGEELGLDEPTVEGIWGDRTRR